MNPKLVHPVLGTPTSGLSHPMVHGLSAEERGGERERPRVTGVCLAWISAGTMSIWVRP